MNGKSVQMRAFPLVNGKANSPEKILCFPGFEPLISEANKKRLAILPSIFLNKMLENTALSSEWPKSVRTSPFVIFTRPNASFRETNPKDDGGYFVYYDERTHCTYRFKIPKGMENLRNAALLIPHGFNDGQPILEIETEKHQAFFLHAQEKYVVAFENFPPESGFYPLDRFYGLPHNGREDNANGNVYYLARSAEHFEFIRRGIYYKHDSKKINLEGKPSEESGALVTSSDLFLDEIVKEARKALFGANGRVPPEIGMLMEKIISAAMQ